MKNSICKILLISLFVIVAFNIKSFGASDFSYKLDSNGNATITAYNGTENNLTIPSTIDGYKVLTIGAHAFDESNNSTNGNIIKNLVISEGIERIELLAFAKCTNLETVQLPETLNFLDMQTFLQCTKLKKINIPSKIKSIGNCTFQETGFTEFDIPENVKSIDTRALGICTALEKVRVYSKNLSYESGVFEHCSSNLVLYGYKDSTTQKYAEQNGIKFELLSSREQEKTITNDFELSLCSSSNGEVQYGVYIKIDDENKLLTIKAKDFNLPSNLYNYQDDIRLRITYSQVDYKVLDCKVINYKTGEIIEDLSEENINKLFNIEYGKTVTERNWVDVIKLSELKENEIYKYTATSTIQFPKIENDTEKNCLLYIKQSKFSDDYKKEIRMYKKISSSAISFSDNEYNSGESFSITYKKMETKELLKEIPEDEIIYLNKYNNGDNLKYKFEKYIYNDTEKDITIDIKNKTFGVETSESVIIPKGEIYGFDCLINSAVVRYTENNNKNVVNENKNTVNNTVKNNVNNTTNNTTNKTNNAVDNTQAKDNLPKTGINMSIYFIILLTIVFVILTYKKYKDLNDVK